MPLDNPLELLKLCDLAKQWPNLKGLHDLTMKQLEKASKEAEKQLAKERAEEEKAAAEERVRRQIEINKANKADEPKLPPIEKSMRGATASTFAEFGKSIDEEKPPAKLPGAESYFEATGSNTPQGVRR